MIAILTAFSYNAKLTFEYLLQNTYLESYLKELVAVKTSISHKYERKVITLGISDMLAYPELPKVVGESFKSLLEMVIDILHKL